MHDAPPPSASWRASRTWRAWRAWTIGLVGTAVVSAACTGSTNSAASTTTTTAAAAASTITSAPSASGSSSDAAQIQSLSSALQAGEHATFKATYTSHTVSGTSETITIEQKPPKSVFSTGTTSVIDDGTHTYFCNPSVGSEQCVSESNTGANPLGSITAIFDPTTVLSEFQAAEAQAAAHVSGYSLAFSTGTYVGLGAKCVNFTNSTQTVKYCVTNSGILAYVQSAGSTFELTSYSSSPADGDFSLPAGATVLTIPTIPTSP